VGSVFVRQKYANPVGNLIDISSPWVSNDIARWPIFPENLKATKEAFCEENLDMVFTRFRFIGECRVRAQKGGGTIECLGKLNLTHTEVRFVPVFIEIAKTTLSPATGDGGVSC
jgi:hypothetical protein